MGGMNERGVEGQKEVKEIKKELMKGKSGGGGGCPIKKGLQRTEENQFGLHEDKKEKEKKKDVLM